LQTHRDGPFYREEAKRYYRNQENIEKKWLDRFGSVSRDNDYQRNRDCLAEVFNMLDIVMEICIEDFRKTHRIVAIDIEGKTPVYTFDLTDDETRTNDGDGQAVNAEEADALPQLPASCHVENKK
jgi:hypothetical protein